MVVAHAVTALAHVPFAIALCAWLPAWGAIGVSAVLVVATSVRLRFMVKDGRRALLLTRLVDEPLLAHWCACVLAMFLLPLSAFVFASARLVGLSRLTFVHAEVVSYGFSLFVASWGLWVRRRFIRVSHVDIAIAGLSSQFDGYRIAQVSDLHIGNHDRKERGLEWAARVNRLEPDLVAVTGDLVTTGSHFYEDAADVIGALRGKDGVFVSMGNHDQKDADDFARAIEARGPSVLRNGWSAVRRGDAELVVAGIDDRLTGKDDLGLTLAGRPPDSTTVLLSHYPDFFPDAVRHGVDLMLAGHTHGGQIAVPFIARRASLSRLAGQARAGLHVKDRTRLYVNAGLGTTGPPVRVGVAPEIAMFVLRRA